MAVEPSHLPSIPRADQAQRSCQPGPQIQHVEQRFVDHVFYLKLPPVQGVLLLEETDDAGLIQVSLVEHAPQVIEVGVPKRIGLEEKHGRNVDENQSRSAEEQGS